jgi:GTPase SAR1 family protein
MPATLKQTRPAQGIVAFRNGDKPTEEAWNERRSRDIGNFPNPSRILLLGPPNVGKSTLVKNLIIHQRPRFDQVFVIHLDAGVSRDYDDLEPTAMLDDVPPLAFWSDLPDRDEKGHRIKRCVVVDDLEMTHAHKERAKNLGILFRYASSHKNMTVYMCHQSAMDVPPLIRKMSNVWVIWRPRGRNELQTIENRVGLPAGELTLLFDAVAPEARDSICVDLSLHSPARLRLNIWQVIELDD